MNAQEYLSQAYLLDQQIDCKLKQVYNLRTMAMKVTSCFQPDKVSSTKEKSPMENSIVKMIALENEINKDIDDLIELKVELSNFVSKIENSSQRLLLELRYLEGRSWDEVAKTLGFNLRWVYRLHGRALNDADTILINTKFKS